MQASTFMVKGNLGFEVQNRRVAGLAGLKGLSSIRSNNLSFVNVNDNNYKSNPCKLSCGSLSMGAGFARLGLDHVMKSSPKYRSVKAQAASGLYSNYYQCLFEMLYGLFMRKVCWLT